jgi:hypothetical protein
MSRFRMIYVTLVVMGLIGGRCAAQAPDKEPGSAESLTAWEWLAEVALPAAGRSPYVDFILTPSAFDKARIDLADLRLIDGRERELPYALRIRRTENRDEPLPAREFNRATNTDRSVQVSLDLGDKAGEHNAIDIVTTGSDFRRRVRLEGSDNGQAWSTLLDKVYLVRFQVGLQHIDIHTLHYPVSRLRYLRVHVFPDSGNDSDKPEITSMTVYHSVRIPGEYVTQTALLGSREPVRVRGGLPGSAWMIDLGGSNVPCEQLRLDIAEDDLARPFTLEVADPNEPTRPLTSGELRRRAGAERKPLEIQFPEVAARRLRLVVTDFRNPPLTLRSVEHIAPAREVIFARPADLATPVRLYFGNPQAQSPHYDFAANLPGLLDPPPLRASLEAVAPNPIYQPVPKPWSERWPWLVYVVLGSASIILLIVLALLAREAVRQHDAGQRVPAVQG